MIEYMHDREMSTLHRLWSCCDSSPLFLQVIGSWVLGPIPSMFKDAGLEFWTVVTMWDPAYFEQCSTELALHIVLFHFLNYFNLIRLVGRKWKASHHVQDLKGVQHLNYHVTGRPHILVFLICNFRIMRFTSWGGCENYVGKLDKWLSTDEVFSTCS